MHDMLLLQISFKYALRTYEMTLENFDGSLCTKSDFESK